MANILYQWLLMTTFSVAHPFFVSMTDINYNEKDKDLEISVRIFTNDLENTIRKYHSDVKVDILHPVNQQQMNEFVNDYIQKNFQLQLNGKPVQLSFVGYEEQSESIWTYFEVKNVNAVQKVSIVNALLYDYNTSQINMMHVKVKDKEKSDKVGYPETSALFVF